MRAFFTALFVLANVFAGASAQEGDLGPSVGSNIPHPLTLQDQNGAKRTLKDLSGEKGVALFFVRSVDWCPFCQRQVIQVNAYAEAFREKGYEPVSLSYDTIEALENFVAKRAEAAETDNYASPVGITLLSDPGSKAIDAFGIRNTEYDGRGRYEGVPHPIVFLISPEGAIQAKLFEAGYRTRPEIEAILAAADGVAGS